MNREHPEFIVDNMLRGLTKWLRFLGFFSIVAENTHIARDYLQQHPCSIFLTSSSNHFQQLKNYHRFLIKGKTISDQLQELNREFHIYEKINLFLICSLCNVALEPIPTEAVIDKVPEGVRKNVKEFQFCPHCQRVYWQGGHITRLMDKIKRMGIISS